MLEFPLDPPLTHHGRRYDVLHFPPLTAARAAAIKAASGRCDQVGLNRAMAAATSAPVGLIKRLSNRQFIALAEAATAAGHAWIGGTRG